MTKGSRAIVSCVAGLICLLSIALQAQVTSQRLVNASTEPQNWLTYSGSYCESALQPARIRSRRPTSRT